MSSNYSWSASIAWNSRGRIRFNGTAQRTSQLIAYVVILSIRTFTA